MVVKAMGWSDVVVDEKNKSLMAYTLKIINMTVNLYVWFFSPKAHNLQIKHDVRVVQQGLLQIEKL